MTSRFALVLAITTLGACATSDSSLQRDRLAHLKVAAAEGEPLAARDLAIAIMMRGQGAGSFEKALVLARSTQKARIAGGDILYARLLEANLALDEAFKAYLSLSQNRTKPTLFRAQALLRLHHLIDDVRIDASDVGTLLRLAKHSGWIGELAALAAEKGALRIRSDRLLNESREALGVITSYRATPRLSSFAALPLPSARRKTTEIDVKTPFGEPIPSVDGYLSLGENGSGVYGIDVELVHQKGARELRIEKVEQLVVELNGREIAQLNRFSHPGSSIARIAIPPDAAGQLRLWIGSRAPDPRIRVSIRPKQAGNTSPALPRALERLAELDVAMAEKDVFRAVAVTDEFQTLPPIAAVTLSRLPSLDPGFAVGGQKRGQQELLRAGLGLAPDAQEIRRELIVELFSLGDTEVATAMIERMPNAPLALDLLKAQETQDSRRARTLSSKLISQLPTSCSGHLAYMRAHEDRLRFERSNWHRKIPFCGPTQLRAADILTSAWRNQDASFLLKSQMARQSRGVERSRTILALAKLRRSLGQNSLAEKLLRQGLSEGILVKDFLEEIARLRILAKDPRGAADLNAQLVRRGGTELDVAQLRFDPNIDLGLPLTDGLTMAKEALARREKAILEGRPQPSMRILLKERHTRVLDDGSMVHREHRLVELLDDGAIERFGEIPLPADASVLLARTYKLSTNGVLQPIEPEQIREKTSISLPALSPGSIIEVAWLWYSPPEDAAERSWFMPVFNFDDLHGPVVEARLLLRTPQKSRAIVKTYGRLPRQDQLAPNLTRYSLTGIHRAREEKLNPRPDLHRNALFASSDTNLAQVREFLLDRLTENRRALPSVTKWVQKRVKGINSPVDQLRALYNGVIKHVLESDVNVFNSSVAQTLENRVGNRSLVLRTACDIVGLKCELVLLELRYQEDPTGDELPRASRFFYPVVRANLPSGEVWLDPNLTHAPFGYLVPLARGSQGLIMEGGTPTFIRSPRAVEDDGKRRIQCEGTIVDDRSVRVDCVELLTGHEAMDRRNKLSDRGSKYRQRFVSIFAKRIFPLSKIHSIAIENLETPTQALRIAWSADVTLIPDSNHEFVLKVDLSPTYLTRRTVVIPSRTSPLFIDRQFDTDFHLTLRTEGLYRFSQSPRVDTVDHTMLQLERSIEIEEKGQRLDIRKRFHLDVGRVLPQDYSRWVDTARKVDALERVRITIER